uniref:phage tail assembly protein T n=1 Tax=Mannheimia haemolytica TaxID=75985 RepID=UPI000ABC0E7B
ASRVRPKRLSERRKFQITLSLALGKTLEEIEQMPERHFAEYRLFYQEQPFGLWRDDYRTAQLAHLTAMFNRDPKGKAPKLAEFMPFFNRTDEVEEIEDDGVADYLAKR